MGFGFALAMLTITFLGLALPAGAGLATWSWLWGRKRGAPSLARAAAAAVLPFLLIVVWLGWFLAYAAYSQSVRRVDPGLGDSWVVPLKHGYFFCMIELPDVGYLMKDTCSGAPPLSEISALAESGDAIIGISRRDGPFVFDLRSGQVTRHADLGEVANRLPETPQLQSANAFYRERRFGWQDRLAVAGLGFTVLSMSALWLLRFVRPPTAAVALVRA